MHSIMFLLSLTVVSQFTTLKYVEVIRVKNRFSPKEYSVTLIDTTGELKEVKLLSEKSIRVKVFSRATIKYVDRVGSYERYQLIYTEPNTRQYKEPVGGCSWGKELLQ